MTEQQELADEQLRQAIRRGAASNKHGGTVRFHMPGDMVENIVREITALRAQPQAGSVEQVESDRLAAVINGKFAVANWQKYNAERADEIVYQAEKMATALTEAVRVLQSLQPGIAALSGDGRGGGKA